jgi:predicted ATPase with chaperone activity
MQLHRESAESFTTFESLDISITKQPAGPGAIIHSMSDLGVREAILEDIALKIVYLSGPFTLLDLAAHARISFDAAEQLFSRLRSKVLCSVTGMVGNVPEIAITSQGRTRALELLAQNQYAGPMPVSLESYVTEVRRQGLNNLKIHAVDVERAFADLVFDQRTLNQFGTALNSGAPIFLYGPPGSGKSAAAERLSRVLALDEVYIPYAIEIDGQIITVFDPVLHHPVDHSATAARRSTGRDERWVLCKRPHVLVGGELTIEMLDLQYNPAAKYYTGPAQMKANNGVLVIDDFGRQRIAPEDLLNRWVVPLDRRIEFLTLAGGRKIEIPFEMLVVFATNRDPATILDAAFLRRIQTKIHLGETTVGHFRRIFEQVAASRGVHPAPGVIDEIIQLIRDTYRQELRACQPRDLIDQVCWAAKYENHHPVLDRTTLTRAAESYFLPSY